MLADDPRNAEVVFAFLGGNELLTKASVEPARYVIDFQPRNVIEASSYKMPYERIKSMVQPKRQAVAAKEATRNAKTLAKNPVAKVNRHHENFLNHWWFMSYGREDLMARIASLPRYIVCVRVTKRPIFEFISSDIHPNDSLQVFPLADDYSFGVLQSDTHWAWFTAKCSTQNSRPRYTSDTVFDTFPWPQSPTEGQIAEVAAAAVALRNLRRETMAQVRYSLRELYRTLEEPGANPLREAHTRLDTAVRAAYTMPKDADPLAFLLTLNLTVAAKENSGEPITPPGVPLPHPEQPAFITDDCIPI
jgi:hypothetical protein